MYPAGSEGSGAVLTVGNKSDVEGIFSLQYIGGSFLSLQLNFQPIPKRKKLILEHPVTFLSVQEENL